MYSPLSFSIIEFNGSSNSASLHNACIGRYFLSVFFFFHFGCWSEGLLCNFILEQSSLIMINVLFVKFWVKAINSFLNKWNCLHLVSWNGAIVSSAHGKEKYLWQMLYGCLGQWNCHLWHLTGRFRMSPRGSIELKWCIGISSLTIWFQYITNLHEWVMIFHVCMILISP